MPRKGLTRLIILEEAVRRINEQGYGTLSFKSLAEHFDVKPPAMFKHFQNLEALKEALTLYGINQLKQTLQDSVTAKSGEQAFEALCHAYRNFAKTNKGLYQAIQPQHFRKNKEIERSAMQLMAIMLSVLKGFNIAEENFIHLLRIIRSSLHGFIVLEIEFGFGIPVNIDTSFKYQVNTLKSMIKNFTAAF